MPPTESEVRASATPKANPQNNPTTMFKIFQNVQYNVVQHKKYAKEMIKLYKKIDEESFRESFKNALQYLFTFGDTSANVDRVIQFVATFCTSLDDEEEFLMFIFNIIFDSQCVISQAVRYRATQLLAAVLSAMDEDASLDDDLCEKLLATQMQRLQDTRGAVRCRAALALQRLQNPTDPDDEVTRAYRFHMTCDPSSSVRRAIVMTIAKCSRNVPFVLERLCDVDEGVRRAAFLYISAMFLMERKRCSKWYQKVFRRLLNTSILNSFCIYRRNPTFKLMTHREFRVKLAEGLLKKYEVSAPSVRTLPMPEREVRLDQQFNHFPIQEPAAQHKRTSFLRNRCARCAAAKRRRETSVKCSRCKVFLCLGDCWEEYHTLHNLAPSS